MVKDGITQFDELKDGKYRIAESVESLYNLMWDKIYEQLNQNGKLEFERVKSKDEIMKIIYKLLKIGLKLGNKMEANEKMKQYFENNFDIECIIEFLNRRHRTYRCQELNHDYKYIEQDKPLANEKDIERIAILSVRRKKMDQETLNPNEEFVNKVIKKVITYDL